MIDFGTLTILNHSSSQEVRQNSPPGSKFRFQRNPKYQNGVASSEISRFIHEQSGQGEIQISVSTESYSGLYLNYSWSRGKQDFPFHFQDFFDWSQDQNNGFLGFKSFKTDPSLTLSFIEEEKAKVLRRSREQLLLDVREKNRKLQETNLSLQKFVPRDF